MKHLAAITLLTCAMVAGCHNGNDELADVDNSTAPSQEFGKRDWNEHPPTTEFEELAFFYEGFQESRYRAVLETELNLHDDEGRVVATLKPGLIIHSSSIDDVDDTDLSDNNRNKILFDLPLDAEIRRLNATDQERLGGTWFKNEAVISESNNNSEQGGTGQPATRPEPDSEGSDKPEPESEGRSR